MVGSLAAVLLAIFYVERGGWGERELRRTLPVAALISIASFTAQFVHAYSLLSKSKLEDQERAQLVTRMFLWGQFGMLSVVFRVTALSERESS